MHALRVLGVREGVVGIRIMPRREMGGRTCPKLNEPQPSRKQSRLSAQTVLPTAVDQPCLNAQGTYGRFKDVQNLPSVLNLDDVAVDMCVRHVYSR